MSDGKQTSPKAGKIYFADLTIPNAEAVRDFYAQVVGWTPAPLEMSDDNGTYSDFMMNDANGEGVTGVCHARGVNADLPLQWIMYVYVDDIAARLERCVALGGKVLKKYEHDGSVVYALIQDPAGAVMALSPTP